MASSGISSSSPAHGTKRKPETSLESEQRLSKRFDLLNLGKKGGKLYIPVKAHQNAETSSAQPAEAPRRTRSNAITDTMNVDDTRDRIYIHDLDAELSSAEAEDAPHHLVFLPDIEKHLSQLPSEVLASRNPPLQGNELVLYNVPSSISVPDEQDSVRKAISDARQRAQDQQLQVAKNMTTPLQVEGPPTSSGSAKLERMASAGSDAMDLG